MTNIVSYEFVCCDVYLVAVGVATTPNDDQGVAKDGDSSQQPHTETQHQVTHEVLAGAELVRRRVAFELLDVSSQTTEPELIRHSAQGKQLSEQIYGNCNYIRERFYKIINVKS